MHACMRPAPARTMLVEAMMCCRKAVGSVMAVLTATLFSHSNSAHMERNWASAQEAGTM